MPSPVLRCLGVLLPLAITGCADLFPNWYRPGPAPFQRLQAARFDPYPEPDIGPEVVGARPPGATQPRPENERVQNELSFTNRYGQPPPPGLYEPEGTLRGQVYPSINAPTPAITPNPLPPPLTGPGAPPNF